jgi:hypothetical protein
MTENEKKQIEEMAELICDNKCDNGTCSTDGCVCNYNCEYKYSAEALYNAGYRKQSVGEWIDKPTGAYGRMQSWCSACGKHSGIGGIESNRHKPFCPNCGAKMKGGVEE